MQTSEQEVIMSADNSLMQTYMVYSAVLALKLLFLNPVSHMVCDHNKIRRAHLSDLKNLTPFWVVSALYVTTDPDPTTAVNLFRVYLAARLVAVIGYVFRPTPKLVKELAFFLSFTITGFMAVWVIYKYRNCI